MLQGAKRNVFAIFALSNGGDEMNMPRISLFPLFPTAKAINILFFRGIIYGLIAPFDALFQLLLHMAAKFYALQTPLLSERRSCFCQNAGVYAGTTGASGSAPCAVPCGILKPSF